MLKSSQAKETTKRTDTRRKRTQGQWNWQKSQGCASGAGGKEKNVTRGKRQKPFRRDAGHQRIKTPWTTKTGRAKETAGPPTTLKSQRRERFTMMVRPRGRPYKKKRSITGVQQQIRTTWGNQKIHRPSSKIKGGETGLKKCKGGEAS